MLSEQQDLSQSMLNSEQLSSLKNAVGNYSPLQLAWASGYLAAKAEGSSVAVLPTASKPLASSTLTILFGSQTGNAKGVATKLAAQAKAQGLTVDLKSMGEFKPKSIKNVSHLLIVASTNGEGEAPDDAVALHEFLSSKKAPSLKHLHYSVLALGDTSYEYFCQTGKDFDEYLNKLGAIQILPRVDCDVDYEESASEWSETIIEQTKGMLGNSQAAEIINLPTAGATSLYSKQQPFTAELGLSQKITGRESSKDVRHIEIDLLDSGITYQPGDALGVWFENESLLVNELLSVLGICDDEVVHVNKETVTIKEALTSQLEITQTNINFIEFWANKSQAAALLSLAKDKNSLRQYASTHQVIDVVSSAPANVTAQELADSLRKITPRLYSIASSQLEVEDEVHLTVGVVEYENNNKIRTGGASGFLANRLEEGAQVKVFVEHNDNFRLPENNDTPIIMIGPGTGIAPFRAFLQEREAQNAVGDNWLFFGDQTYTQDFLYQVEWQGYVKSGLLTRIDLAFSRDQTEKIYVQDRLKEHGKSVFEWLERGAYLYICGDMNRMAKDVEQVLLGIIETEGGMSSSQAQDYLKVLRSAKRYQKDVY
ncbi:assimilatory sulfite reductase (NADPH) flavoprotein subunit [Thalassotalea piscium]|uniref:Sulfite reductase [NADPH] flavoprotein alpha-component n=1 Tax=Thalassotalea piscium TaxID=1230533 RepID=A0A7X0TUJ4_9GAMM|nr:assimilatory sulfite reductase (NADPH) flavoprotein subunit [Thalassotalea piscium]MBB6544214.1 sulfite reductase (NADPH) flavoprotein alpha-component [Thalassotalea piscium]